MPQTASEYGLALGPLKDLPQFDPSDQRHDDNRATQAAARYLADLYSAKTAASGLLVMAAYNYGQTRIVAKLDQLPDDPRQRNFWNFRRNGWIPPEAHEYVLRVFSAALICENPELFNFKLIPISALWEGASTATPGAASTAAMLSVTSLPDKAAVYIDGQLRGTAPLRQVKLEPGTHMISLKLPGFVDHVQAVVFRSGEELSLSIPLIKADARFCNATGEIVDQADRRKLAGVNVVLTNMEGGLPIAALSDANGRFRFDRVYPPGKFKIRASLQGYYPAEKNDVGMAIGNTTIVIPPLEMTRMASSYTEAFSAYRGKMSHIGAEVCAVPEYRVELRTAQQLCRALFQKIHPDMDRVLSVSDNALVLTRHFAAAPGLEYQDRKGETATVEYVAGQAGVGIGIDARSGIPISTATPTPTATLIFYVYYFAAGRYPLRARILMPGRSMSTLMARNDPSPAGESG